MAKAVENVRIVVHDRERPSGVVAELENLDGVVVPDSCGDCEGGPPDYNRGLRMVLFYGCRRTCDVPVAESARCHGRYRKRGFRPDPKEESGQAYALRSAEKSCGTLAVSL